MKIKSSEFIISAVKREQYPDDNLPEIAFVGRSNVGKSSIINSLTNRRGLAKVSQTPGKTRLINFFLLNKDFYLVDLPGYGYAKVSKKEKASWGATIERYLLNRGPLKKVVLLVDCRHKPTADDVQMYEWIKHYGYEVVVIATKSDKISNNQIGKSEKLIKETLGLPKDHKLKFFSSLNKKGKKNLFIQTPYFVPDEPMLEALRLAALSGVDVKIMLPGNPDHKFMGWIANSYFESLLNAGAKIYLYEKGFLHAKTIVADSSICSVGTANMDIRSFSLNFESNIFIYNEAISKSMEEQFFKDLKVCTKVTLESFEKRSIISRIGESITRLVSPLM